MAFLPREECRRRSREAGEESRELAVAVQAHEAKPYPVQIGPSQDETKTAGQNRAERRRRENLTTPTPQRGRQPRHQPRRGPTLSHFLPGRTNQDKGCHRPAGQAIRSGFPAWTGRRTKDGTRERALLGQTLHRIDPTHTRRPRRGHLHRRYQHDRAIDPEATRLGRGAPTRADGEVASAARRPNRREALPDARIRQASSRRPDRHGRSQSEDHKDVPERGGRRGAG